MRRDDLAKFELKSNGFAEIFTAIATILEKDDLTYLNK